MIKKFFEMNLQRSILRPLSSVRDSFHIYGSLLEAKHADSNYAQGRWLEVKHSFSKEAVESFAQYAGDTNPIHLDAEYAKHGGKRNYKGAVVHGLLAAGLFSAMFGRTFAGSLYVSQNLRFEKPVHVGDELKARIEILSSKLLSSRREVLLHCRTTIANETDGNVSMSGDAKVLVPLQN